MEKDQKTGLGNREPGLKDVLWVLFVVGLLIAFSWIAWFKFGWFH